MGIEKDKLTWSDIRFICEGLAFAGRPIAEATRDLLRKYSLGPRGLFALSMISDGVRYPAQLSDALGVGRNLITAEVSRLTKAKLVVASRNQRDRRNVRLTPTDLGERELRKMRSLVTTTITRNLESYSSDEIREFGIMLHAISGLTASNIDSRRLENADAKDHA